jgi:hypothetical protein
MSNDALHYTEPLGNYMEAEVTEIKPKTLVWTIRNKNNGYVLGWVKWYAPWRQYCFYPNMGFKELRDKFVHTFLLPDRYYEKNELQKMQKNILDDWEREMQLIFSASCMQTIVDFTKRLRDKKR